MARYDEGWSGGWGGPPPERGFGMPGRSYGGMQGRGGQRPPPWTIGEGVYGPERYGLGPYHERLRRRRRPDDELKQEVEETLFLDTWIDADAISVTVRDGVVTLTGTLPSFDEVRYATDDAWDIEGVLGVQSDLNVHQ